MKVFKSYKAESKSDWGVFTQDPNLVLDNSQITVGCLLRIADAVEKVAIRHTDLMDARDRYERESKTYRERVTVRDRTISALKGVITKMKKAGK